ncbi:hypothetical protein GIB67_031323 [Kingdonia uniflora]|uniref:Uncharacterized protein n=1 Tax=Kingdonia uniflora TaxID=39325 RepID=A0A7J7NS89_9MAGN|nr:hypothetical protein GIB67_031323 [Kingdonia uniflora]
MPRGRTVTNKPTLAQDVARIEDKLDKLVEALGRRASPPQPPPLGVTEDLSLEESVAARSDDLNNPFVDEEFEEIWNFWNTVLWAAEYCLLHNNFLLFWFYVAPVPGRMGYTAAVGRFLKIMAMVWAGSQVTKLVRAGGALALAPFVDRGLSWITVKFKFKSQTNAFMAIVGVCFGLALVLFFGITLLWA